MECGIITGTCLCEEERWAGEVHIARASVAGDIDGEPTAHVYFDGHVG